MNLISSSKLIEKKSKFFAYLYELDSEEELIEIISKLKKDHKKAAHICYGLILDKEVKFKNDGEVGNPGRALLETLKENDCTSNLLIVARIFGGIKLGPGGVSRAFRKAGRALF